MTYLKKIIKIIAITILTLASLVGIYLLSAYCLSRIAVEKEPVAKEEVTIYILTNGVHTDLVLPIRNDQVDWSKEIKAEYTLSKDTAARYVAFGWGDKGFYLETPTWAELKFSTAFNAGFALSTSAIHATFYKKMYEGKACKKIKISKEQYARLVEFIRSSFITDSDGHFIVVQTKARYSKDDAFYEAKGKYNLFYTCNTWANNGLKSCGQKACVWTPFDTGIFYQYQNN